MGIPSESARAFRISCANFTQDETAALARLLRLLASSLKQPWVLAGLNEPADLILVNLDAEGGSAYGNPGPYLGCSVKPRQHVAGTLHWPPRSYEILPILNKAAARGGGAATADNVRNQARDAPRSRLHFWPAEAMSWPREWWIVMATLRHQLHNVEETALLTGLKTSVVRECVAELDRLGALTHQSAPRPASPPPSTRAQDWRALTTRIGQIMGFSR